MKFPNYCILTIVLAITIEFFLFSNVSASKVDELDHKLFNYIHKDMQNRFLDRTTPTIQKMGDPTFYLGLCSLLCAIGDEKKVETGRLLFSGFVESGLLAYSIKEISSRQRPMDKDQYDSFPSGHSTLAFTIAAIASNEYPKLRIPLYLAAFGTAYSRVYLGRHYPSDVLVGAIIGTLIGIQITYTKGKILSIQF